VLSLHDSTPSFYVLAGALAGARASHTTSGPPVRRTLCCRDSATRTRDGDASMHGGKPCVEASHVLSPSYGFPGSFAPHDHADLPLDRGLLKQHESFRPPVHFKRTSRCCSFAHRRPLYHFHYSYMTTFIDVCSFLFTSMHLPHTYPANPNIRSTASSRASYSVGPKDRVMQCLHSSHGIDA
jgi:hypothetical protein